MKRPHVTLKFAQSLDGKIATQTGESRGLSSKKARQFSHRLRTQHQAILVGSKTVLKDNPLLTVRLVRGKSPLRIILDSNLSTPLNARIVSQLNKARTLIATTRKASRTKIKLFKAKGVAIWIFPQASGKINLRLLLARLAKTGIKKLLVEGGQEVITAFLKENLADRLVAILTPKIVGKGIAAVGDLGILRVNKSIRLRLKRLKKLGPDIIYIANLN